MNIMQQKTGEAWGYIEQLISQMCSLLSRLVSQMRPFANHCDCLLLQKTTENLHANCLCSTHPKRSLKIFLRNKF